MINNISNYIYVYHQKNINKIDDTIEFKKNLSQKQCQNLLKEYFYLKNQNKETAIFNFNSINNFYKNI